jgi:hypothetical protein
MRVPMAGQLPHHVRRRDKAQLAVRCSKQLQVARLLQQYTNTHTHTHTNRLQRCMATLLSDYSHVLLAMHVTTCTIVDLHGAFAARFCQARRNNSSRKINGSNN